MVKISGAALGYVGDLSNYMYLELLRKYTGARKVP